MVDRLSRLMALDSLEIRSRLMPDRWRVFGSCDPVAADAETVAAVSLSNL
jgi:hypothetical protein